MTRSPNRARPLPMGLVVIYEDHDLLVVDKPAGLLTMATDRQETRNAYYLMMDYVRKGNYKSRARVFIVHRLDKDTSGVLLFAKNEESKMRLQEDWEHIDKRYLAVVHGGPETDSGSITSYLYENDSRMVYSTRDQSLGKYARTDFDVVKRTPDYAVLDVQLLTGRKNQIRVHCADHGFPIVGDTKYGYRKDPCPKLALHALSIEFRHPMTDESIYCTARIPALFRRLVGGVAGFLSHDDDR